VKGFYKGLTASYMGISETVLHFVIYEKLKEKILSRSVNARGVGVESDKSPLDFAEFMIAGGMSKTLACITFYPHGETLLLAVTFGSFINIVCVVVDFKV